MLTLDHIVIAAEKLEDGVGYVQDRLGVDIPFGGKHPLMGTHNHVMQLGPEAFLEVIAIDPQVSVDRVRWFGLNEFGGPPRIVHWVVRVVKMAQAFELDVDIGRAIDVTRGEMFWQLSVRDDGTMPFDGSFPSIIDWPDGQFPVPRMADLGCTLERFVVTHPDAEQLRKTLSGHFDDPRVEVKKGPLSLIAEIRTPDGLRSI